MLATDVHTDVCTTTGMYVSKSSYTFDVSKSVYLNNGIVCVKWLVGHNSVHSILLQCTTCNNYYPRATTFTQNFSQFHLLACCWDCCYVVKYYPLKWLLNDWIFLAKFIVMYACIGESVYKGRVG